MTTTTATGQPMPHDPNQWTLIALLTSATNFLAGLNFSEWLALLGAIGMLISLGMQFVRFLGDRELQALDKRIKVATLKKLEQEQNNNGQH